MRAGKLMGFAVFGLICGCAGGATVLMVAGGLLRLAVNVANRTIAPVKAAGKPTRRSGIAEWDWDDWDDEGAVADEPDRPWRALRAIPEPGTLKSMAIMLVTSLVFVLGYILIGFAAAEMGFRMWREETQLAVAILNLPIAGLTLTLTLILMLPTRFWRAAMVTFMYGLVVVAFVLFIGLVVLFVTRIR